MDAHLRIIFNASMLERLSNREVGIVQLHILAHQRNVHCPAQMAVALHHRYPVCKIRRAAFQVQLPDCNLRQALFFQSKWNLIERGHITVFNHMFLRHIAKQRDFLTDMAVNWVLAPAYDHIRPDAEAQKLLYAVLCGLSFQLHGGAQVGNQCHMDKHAVFPPMLLCKLADCLKEGLALNIAHRAADLYEYHISLRIQSNAPLDLIGDVWNHLDGLPAVNSFTLIADNLKKDTPGG